MHHGDSLDFGATPEAFRQAFEDRFKRLESFASSATSSDCGPCQELLAASGYSPASARAAAATGGAPLLWLAGLAVIVALVVGGYFVYRHFVSKGLRFGSREHGDASPRPSKVRKILEGALAVPQVSRGAHVVFYGAEWCGHCQNFGPKFEALAHELSSEELQFSKCAFELVPNDMKDMLKLMAMPAIFHFHPEGHRSIVGNRPLEVVRKFIVDPDPEDPDITYSR